MITVQLTVGKVDAGVAVLLTPDHHLLEFPSLLLPPDIEAGSLIDISVQRNRQAEQKCDEAFQILQEEIYQDLHPSSSSSFCSAPELSVIEKTPTQLHLSWDHGLTLDPIHLHLYVNEQLMHSFPYTPLRPFTSVSIHGEYILQQLTPNQEYSLQLQFTNDVHEIVKSNVVNVCTLGQPMLDPSTIPLPTSPPAPSASSSSFSSSSLASPTSPGSHLETVEESMESLDLTDSSSLSSSVKVKESNSPPSSNPLNNPTHTSPLSSHLTTLPSSPSSSSSHPSSSPQSPPLEVDPMDHVTASFSDVNLD